MGADKRRLRRGHACWTVDLEISRTLRLAFASPAFVPLALSLGLLAVGAVGAAASPVAANPALGEGRAISAYETSPLRTGHLPNGLRYVILPHAAEGPVELQLVVEAGDYDEDEDQNGVAHLVEHVVAATGVERLARFGLTLGNGVAAETRTLATLYRVSIPPDQDAAFLPALEVLSGWASSVRISDEDVDRERAAVLAEFAFRSNTPEIRTSAFRITRLVDSPCANEHLERARPGVIAAATPEVVRRFYRDWYRPELMTVVVAGSIDPERAEAEIRRAFADLSASGDRRAYARERCRVEPIRRPVSVLESPGRDGIELYLRLNMPRPPASGDRVADERRRLIWRILNSALNTRGGDLTQRYLSPYTAVSFGHDVDGAPALAGLETFDAIAFVRAPDAVLPAVQDLAAQIARLRATGLSSAEFDAARAAVALNIDRPMSLADQVEALLSNGGVFSGEALTADEQRPVLASLSLSEVNAELTRATNRTDHPAMVITARPEQAAALADHAALESVLDGLAAVVPAPDATRRERAAPMIPDERARLVRRGYAVAPAVNEAGVLTARLRNGLRIRLRTDEAGGEPVRVSLAYPAPIERRAPAEAALRRAAADAAYNGGVGELDRFELAAVLAARGVSYNVDVTSDAAYAAGEASAAGAELLLQTLHMSILHPRWDPLAVADWKRSMEDRRAETLSTNAALDRAVADFFGLPALDGPSAEVISALNAETLEQPFADLFSNAADALVVVTGSASPSRMLDLLDLYLGALPGDAAPDEIRDAASADADVPLPEPAARVATVHASSATVAIETFGHLPDALRERVKIELLSNILDVRILNRIRTVEGGAYAPGAAAFLRKDGQGRAVYGVSVRFGCEAARADALRAAALQEIERLRRDGPTFQEVEEALLRERTQPPDLSIPRRLHDFLVEAPEGSDLVYGDQERLAILKSVSTDEMKVAAGAYLDPGHQLQITVLPMDAAPAPSTAT